MAPDPFRDAESTRAAIAEAHAAIAKMEAAARERREMRRVTKTAKCECGVLVCQTVLPHETVQCYECQVRSIEQRTGKPYRWTD